MKKIAAALSSAILIFAVVQSVEAKPKKENILYTMSYTYEFKGENDVSNCVTRATVALTKNGLSTGLKTEIEDDGRYGFVYGWSPDSTASAEIDCDMDEKESNLSYARYSEDQDLTWELWNRLKDSRW